MNPFGPKKRRTIQNLTKRIKKKKKLDPRKEKLALRVQSKLQKSKKKKKKTVEKRIKNQLEEAENRVAKTSKKNNLKANPKQPNPTKRVKMKNPSLKDFGLNYHKTTKKEKSLKSPTKSLKNSKMNNPLKDKVTVGVNKVKKIETKQINSIN